MNPEISICIPHWPYNEEIDQVLFETLMRIEENTIVPFEVCLVINGGDLDPMAETRACVSRIHAGKEWLKIKMFMDPIGNSRGWNEGYKMASAPVVAFMDNDVFVEYGWAKPIVEALKEDAKLGMAIPQIFVPDGAPFGKALKWEKGWKRVPHSNSGCAMVLRRNTLKFIEGEKPFDEQFETYAEDTDLMLRVRLAGLRRKVIEASKVKHLVGSTCYNVFGDQPGVDEKARLSRDKFEKKWERLGYTEINGNRLFNCWRMWQ